MAGGKHEEFNPKRRPNREVAREAMGDKYVEIGVGFGDDPRVVKAIAEEKEMRGGVDMADIASSVTEEDENIHPDLTDEQLMDPEFRYEPYDDIDYESEIALRDLYY